MGVKQAEAYEFEDTGAGDTSVAGPDHAVSWQQAFQAAIDPMLVVDDGQRIVDVNPALCELLAYSPAEIRGRKLAEVIAPRQRDLVDRAWARMMLAGGGRAEWLAQDRDGALVEIEVSAAVNVADGTHLFVARDVTEQKRVEAEALRRAEQQEAVANIGRVALTDVGARAMMQLAAEELARVLAIELVGAFELQSSGGDLVLRAGVGWAAGTIGDDTISKTGSVGRFVIDSDEPVLVDDLEREVRFTVPPLLRAHGVVSGLSVGVEGGERPFGVLGAYTREAREFSADDIHFVRSVANLLGAALARERVRRLETQLEQSRRLESIGQLAGGIAHDFNNLLGVIMSYATFALEELEPESQLHGDISEVVTAAEHGAELTKQLLLFASRQIVDVRAVDPNEVARNTSAILGRALGPGIELRCDLAERIRPVQVGHGQLEQVVMNLAMNARDAMPDGGKLVIETSLLEHPAGARVRLRVSDTGTGMTEEVASQAFQPFFTTKDRGQGTGLGMATVYGIVQAAGGEVRIDSAPGQGTTIEVELPASDETGAREVAAAPSSLRGFGETVLLVEDDVAARRATERILRRNGYEVKAVANAEEALRVSESGTPVDLLLTDVALANLTGPELASRVREGRHDVPVVFISGSAELSISPGDELGEGAILIEKPFTESALLAGLRAGIESAGA
jgi:PAS domain S-box-containing protein